MIKFEGLDRWEIENIYEYIRQFNREYRFFLGDLLNYGDVLDADDSLTGMDYSTIQNYKRTSKKYPKEKRVFDVSWSNYRDNKIEELNK